jgi:hypothetical protein
MHIVKGLSNSEISRSISSMLFFFIMFTISRRRSRSFRQLPPVSWRSSDTLRISGLRLSRLRLRLWRRRWRWR